MKVPEKIIIVNLYPKDHPNDESMIKHVHEQIGEPDLSYCGRVFQVNHFTEDDLLYAVEYHLQDYVTQHDIELYVMAIPTLLGQDKYQFDTDCKVTNVVNNSEEDVNKFEEQIKVLLLLSQEDEVLQYWQKRFLNTVKTNGLQK